MTPAAANAIPIQRVHFVCRECRIAKDFGDPEEAPSFPNWIAAVRGHIISFHRTLKIYETENSFLRAVYL